jgi:hypothetical protein
MLGLALTEVLSRIACWLGRHRLHPFTRTGLDTVRWLKRLATSSFADRAI